MYVLILLYYAADENMYFSVVPPHHRISGPEHDFLIGVRDCYIFLYFTIFYLRVTCPGHMHSFCSIIYYYTFIWSLTVIFPTRFLIPIYYTRQRYINGYGIFFFLTLILFTPPAVVFFISYVPICMLKNTLKHYARDSFRDRRPDKYL